MEFGISVAYITSCCNARWSFMWVGWVYKTTWSEYNFVHISYISTLIWTECSIEDIDTLFWNNCALRENCLSNSHTLLSDVNENLSVLSKLKFGKTDLNVIFMFAPCINDIQTLYYPSDALIYNSQMQIKLCLPIQWTIHTHNGSEYAAITPTTSMSTDMIQPFL